MIYSLSIKNFVDLLEKGQIEKGKALTIWIGEDRRVNIVTAD